MTPKLDQKLFAAYPRIYAGKDKPITDSCMPWGFECDDGWQKLLHTFSALATAYDKQFNLGLEILQVKEKFGSLRIYTMGGDDVIDELVSLVEASSYQTCEECGIQNNEGYPDFNGYAKVVCGPIAPGGHWIKTLCDRCRSKRSKG